MRRIVISLLVTGMLALGAASAAPAAPPSHKAKQKNTPIGKIVKQSVPLPIPKGKAAPASERIVRPDGPPVEFKGAPPRDGVRVNARNAPTDLRRDTSGAYWPGAYYNNPARQSGKLYFWTGDRWSHCTATAINTASKSLVLTAGHCVFDTINNRWYSSEHFCPGYKHGCKLGVWYASRLGTTSSWVNSTNTNYHWEDDIGVVKVKPNPSKGYLVNYTGGQGIAFNQSTGLYRSAFGYPAPDSRWPQYNWNGEDLAYCQASSVYDGAGHLRIPCTMTGGASGGPWLSYVGSNWLGYVTGVNSHKAWGGAYMGSPYFDNTELNVWNYWKTQ